MNRFRAKFEFRPIAYVSVLSIVMLASFAFHLRTAGIFACEGDGYSPDSYMAYCNSVSYLNYDQGAFWFQTEQQAYENARNAEILFVGNSKLQFAMSTKATKSWFASIARDFYLFGFAQYETAEYFSAVLATMQPRAKAYVVHIDRLFEDRVTPPFRMIREDGDAEAMIRRKKMWQPVHRAICSRVAKLCGREFGLYRDRGNGSWSLTGEVLDQYATEVGDASPTDSDLWPEYAVSARRFIEQLPVDRACIFLTLVPSESTRRAEAQSIADFLNMPLFSPRLQNLKTFDAEHLDLTSAERWSASFLNSAGPEIEACLAAG